MIKNQAKIKSTVYTNVIAVTTDTVLKHQKNKNKKKTTVYGVQSKGCLSSRFNPFKKMYKKMLHNNLHFKISWSEGKIKIKCKGLMCVGSRILYEGIRIKPNKYEHGSWRSPGEWPWPLTRWQQETLLQTQTLQNWRSQLDAAWGSEVHGGNRAQPGGREVKVGPTAPQEEQTIIPDVWWWNSGNICWWDNNSVTNTITSVEKFKQSLNFVYFMRLI